mmetsp:Transcript_19311/g.31172  ORF Transcript_19311/g.31172 Transcript_19311/m.31172 type:complete len:237 (-) Transcript_19311:725-1435(-)
MVTSSSGTTSPPPKLPTTKRSSLKEPHRCRYPCAPAVGPCRRHTAAQASDGAAWPALAPAPPAAAASQGCSRRRPQRAASPASAPPRPPTAARPLQLEPPPPSRLGRGYRPPPPASPQPHAQTPGQRAAAAGRRGLAEGPGPPPPGPPPPAPPPPAAGRPRPCRARRRARPGRRPAAGPARRGRSAPRATGWPSAGRPPPRRRRPQQLTLACQEGSGVFFSFLFSSWALVAGLQKD